MEKYEDSVLEKVRFPIWEEYDYTVKYELDGEKFGMYVQAENEDEAKQKVRRRNKDNEIRIFEVVRGMVK